MATNYWSVPFSNLSPLGTIPSLNPSSDYLEVTSVNHQIKLIKLSSFFVRLSSALYETFLFRKSYQREHERASLANVSLISNHRDFICLDWHKRHNKLWMEMCFSCNPVSLNTVNQLYLWDTSFWRLKLKADGINWKATFSIKLMKKFDS